MNPQTSTKAVFAIIACAAAFGLARSSRATEAPGGTKPCAILESASGESEVLDSSRTHLAEALPNTPIPCGGWVSVTQGVAKIKHRFGYEIHLGSGSFAQFMESEDSVLLFRGQLFGAAGGGMGELRVLTPNARIKISRGEVAALFDSDEESTQLITLQGKAAFENRFDSTAIAHVKGGETSTLDFKLLRVIPSVPKVVAIASIKLKLHELDVSAKSNEKAFAVIRNREKETFAPAVQPDDGRQPASIETAKAVKTGAEGGDDSELKTYWESKTVGGETEGLKILKHGKHAGERQPAKVAVDDPEAQLDRKQKDATDMEKQRLIEELSKIKTD